MAGNPGLEALLKCNEQVTVDIRNHLDDVANYLRGKDIISLQLFTSVTDVTSRDPEYTRAKMVFKRLQDMVQGNEKYYFMFMDYLRSNPLKFGNSISMLDKAYVNNGRILPAGGNPEAIRNAPVHQPPAIQAVWTKKVQMFALNIIKYYDTNNKKAVLRLLDEMAPNWQVISGTIGFSAAEIAAVQQPGAGKTNRQCIHEIITKWMRNAPGMPKKNRYPNTWQGILNMLEDSEIADVAEQLEAAVNATYSDLHDNYENAPAEGVVAQQQLPAQQRQHQPAAAPAPAGVVGQQQVPAQPPQVAATQEPAGVVDQQGGVVGQQQVPAQQPQVAAAQGKRKKMNKNKLADWLDEMGVDDVDIKRFKDQGVNEILFLNLTEGDKILENISNATLLMLKGLQDTLRST